MRKDWAFRQTLQNLVGLVFVGMVVRMSLKFERQVVGHHLRRIPGMLDVHRFELPILIFLSLQSVMLDIVNCLKQKDKETSGQDREG